jgi:aryl-alcohol dehydrogenase-like predicted oxidoreductase
MPLNFLDKLNNKIGLGLAALGRPEYINIHHNQELGSDKSKEKLSKVSYGMIDYAFSKGIKYFDAARVYGASEEFLSNWSKLNKDKEVYCGSKWGYEYLANWELHSKIHERKDHSLNFFKKQLAESKFFLEHKINLYQIHSATKDTGVLNDNKILDSLYALKEEGIQIGISTTGLDQNEMIEKVIEINKKSVLFSSIQSTYNIFEQNSENYLIKARHEGISIIIKEVFANGRLSSKNHKYNHEIISDMKQHSLVLNQSIENMAFLWVLQKPWVDIVLSGATTKTQIDENFNCLQFLKLELGFLKQYKLPSDLYWLDRKKLNWN